MKSDMKNSSSTKIEKATNLLWKVWWFCFYLIILPAIGSTIGFFIFYFIIKDPIISSGFAVIGFIFFILLFYRSFDKYRNKPFFLNKSNNLSARIHVFFLISLGSLVVTPIFEFITPAEYSFSLLPVISYGVLYNIIYYYLYFQPVDVFNGEKKEFEHYTSFKKSLKEPYNLIILINFVVNIIFLSLVFSSEFSWLFTLIANSLAYGFALIGTSKIRMKFATLIQEGMDVTIFLVRYKQKFMLSVINLIFILLIQMPFVLILSIVNMGISLSVVDLINSFFVSLYFFAIYLKSTLFIKFRDQILPIPTTQPGESTTLKREKLQNNNFYLSLGIVILSTLLGIYSQSWILIFSIIIVSIILTIFEEKWDLTPKSYSRYVLLMNSLVLIIFVYFWIIPEILLNVKFVAFFITLYVILELFVRKDYFSIKKILITQHFLAVFSFYFIAYSIFPSISLIYLNFTATYFILLIAQILLHSLVIVSVLLGSLYYLYARYFYKNRWEKFNLLVIINFILCEALAIVLINIRNIFISISLVGNLILPLFILLGIFAIFTFINYAIGMFSKNTSLSCLYYSSWTTLFLVFFLTIFNYYTIPIVIVLDVLMFLVITPFMMRFGVALNKVKQEGLYRFLKFNFYALSLICYILLFFGFYNWLIVYEQSFNIMVSAYLSYIINDFIIVILYRLKIIGKSFPPWYIFTFLLFTSFIVFYFTFTFTFGSYFMFFIPFIFTSISLYLPIFYLKVKKLYPNFVDRAFIAIDMVLSFFLLSIPSIIALELISAGYTVDLITIFNFTAYILYVILLGFYYLPHITNSGIVSRDLILKLQIIIEIIIAITTIFYYSWLWLLKTSYSLVLPFIFTSSFLLVPFLYSFKKQFFNIKWVKLFTLINYIFLWINIISLPTLIGLDLQRIGVFIDINWFILGSIILIFFFFKIFEKLSFFVKLSYKNLILIKWCQISTWLSFSGFVSYAFGYTFLPQAMNTYYFLILSFSAFFFFILNTFILYQLKGILRYVTPGGELDKSYYRLTRLYDYVKLVIYLGCLISISSVLTLVIEATSIIELFFATEMLSLVSMVHFSIFLLFLLVLLKLTGLFIKIEFSKVIARIEIVAWFAFKCSTIVLLSIIPIPVLLLDKIFLIILIISLLYPISVHYIEKNRILSDTVKFKIRFVGLMIYHSSFFFLSFEVALVWMNIVPNFNQNAILTFLNLSIIIYLYCSTIFSRIYQSGRSMQASDLILHYIIPSILLICLILTTLNVIVLNVILILFSLIIITRNRETNLIHRFFTYFSFTTLIYSILMITVQPLITGSLLLGSYLYLYLLVLMGVIFASIVINLKRINDIEKFFLYFTISLFSFIFLLTHNLIPAIYNFTISVLILLSLFGIFFYRKGDAKYKWFIRPCLLLSIFDIISFLSNSVLFKIGNFSEYEWILTLSFTLSITGFSFVFIYNDSPTRFRKFSFYTVFAIYSISVPVFFYFMIIASLSLPLWSPFPFLIALNVGIVMIYVSIAIYKWTISWIIWKLGWWLWILLPFINFYMINHAFTGIDLYTNALNFFDVFEMDGSFIISIMICVILSLPFWYEWIKTHFTYVLFLVWGFSLFLIYWFSQNIFVGNLVLVNSLFLVLSVLLLLPLFYKLKFWKLMITIWLISAFINVTFLFLLFEAIGFLFELNLSLTILLGGLHGITLSFFPNLRAQKEVLIIISYMVSLTGLFFMVFTIIFNVILNLPIALNISFIILGFSLLSSRLLKLSKNIVNALISIILILNFTSLTFFTLLLIPYSLILSIFISIAVFGSSFYFFNRFNMIIPVKNLIPLIFISFGISSTISYLIFLLIPSTIFITIAIFVFLNSLFAYFSFREYRYFLIFIYPIPIVLLSLQVVIIFEIFQSILILILFSLLLYTALFQILFNNLIKSPKLKLKESIKPQFFKEIVPNDLKKLNLLCFSLMSFYFSLLVSQIIPLDLFFKTMTFFIVLSFLLLSCIKYIEISKISFNIENLAQKLMLLKNVILFVSYLEISTILYSIILNFTPLTLLENVLITIIVFFLLSLIDIKLVKKHVPINVIAYIIVSSGIFIYLLGFMSLYWQIIFLNLLIVFVMQFYTVSSIMSFLKAHERFEVSHLISIQKKMNVILLNMIFVLISLYVSLSIFTLIPLYSLEFTFILSMALFISIFSMMMTLLSYLNRFMARHSIMFIFSMSFLVSFELLLSIVLLEFEYVNSFSILLSILAGTVFLFYPISLLKKASPERFNTLRLSNFKLAITFILYLEVTLLFFGFSYLFLDILSSIAISQAFLLTISTMEVFIIKRFNQKLISFLQLISYCILSSTIFLKIIFVVISSFYLTSLSITFFIISQILTNYLYYFIKKGDAIRQLEHKKAFLQRQKLIAAMLYLSLLNLSIQALLSLHVELLASILIISIIIHLISTIDKYTLKLFGKSDHYFIIFSWIIVLLSSLIFFTVLILLANSTVFIFLFLVVGEIIYSAKLLGLISSITKFERKLLNALLFISYLNTSAWPLFFIGPELILNANLILLTLGLMVIFSFIDNAIKVITPNIRKKIQKVITDSFFIVLSLNVFLMMTILLGATILLNVSVSALIFIIYSGFRFKPFKKEHLASFIYWTVLFLDSSFLLSLACSSPGYFGIFILGILIFPFIFMLEELKHVISNLVNYIRIFLVKIKNFTILMVNIIIKFLISHFKFIKILLCALAGISAGALFSELVLGILEPWQSTLLSISVFFLLFGLIPSGNKQEGDELFYERMKRLAIVWISITVFIYTLILPIIESILLWTILVIPPIWGLGSIMLFLIHRKEKRQQISIKWRFFTTLISILLFVFWIVLLIVLWISS